MRTTILVLALLAVPSIARAEAAYYETAKVVTDCAVCKTEQRALEADAKQHQAEVNKLLEEAKAAEAACGKRNIVASVCGEAAAKSKRADELLAKYQDQINQRRADSYTRTQARVMRILPDLAKVRHLTAIISLGGAFYVAPSANLTAEIVRRLDAGEGKGDDELRAELAKAQAEIAKLKSAKDPPKK